MPISQVTMGVEFDRLSFAVDVVEKPLERLHAAGSRLLCGGPQHIAVGARFHDRFDVRQVLSAPAMSFMITMVSAGAMATSSLQ